MSECPPWSPVDQTLILIESSRILRKNINFMTNKMCFYVSFASKIQYELKNRGGSKNQMVFLSLKNIRLNNILTLPTVGCIADCFKHKWREYSHIICILYQLNKCLVRGTSARVHERVHCLFTKRSDTHVASSTLIQGEVGHCPMLSRCEQQPTCWKLSTARYILDLVSWPWNGVI